jgi:hypothetical protein
MALAQNDQVAGCQIKFTCKEVQQDMLDEMTFAVDGEFVSRCIRISSKI